MCFHWVFRIDDISGLDASGSYMLHDEVEHLVLLVVILHVPAVGGSESD